MIWSILLHNHESWKIRKISLSISMRVKVHKTNVFLNCTVQCTEWSAPNISLFYCREDYVLVCNTNRECHNVFNSSRNQNFSRWTFKTPSSFWLCFVSLKGVFAKNERGYRLNAIKKRFWSILILLLSVASIRRKLIKTPHTEERSAHTNWGSWNIRLRP